MDELRKTDLVKRKSKVAAEARLHTHHLDS